LLRVCEELPLRQGAESGIARNTTTVVELVATVVTYVGPAAVKCVAVVAIAACELKLDVGTRSAADEPMPVTPAPPGGCRSTWAPRSARWPELQLDSTGVAWNVWADAMDAMN
jgi:hypothetical protein